MQSLNCENYEICLGEGDSLPVLTFDVDDITPTGLAHITSLRMAEDGVIIGLASGEGEATALEVRFPFYEGLPEIFDEIKQSPGRIFVAALGTDPNDEQGSVVAYGGEFPLA